MYIGRGRGVRIAPGTDRSGIRGARFLVRTDAATALRAGVSALRGARFTPDAKLQARLSAAGSPWNAQALTIGRPASRWGLPAPDYGDFPLNLLPLLWPRVALTLAVACARTTGSGTDLVIFAHPSMLHAGERTNDSGALMSKAAANLQQRFTASDTLLRHAPIASVDDEDCPASGMFVRTRLGWT